MSAEGHGTTGDAEHLRRAFDQTFAHPAPALTQQIETLLGLRLGGDPYAVRAREIAGLLADQRIVPLPSPVPQLLGIAGRRGEIVPVYDLGALLGYPGDREATRWMVLAGSGPLVGLAFDQFDGQLSIPASNVRPIIDVAALLETIRGASSRAAPRRTTETIGEK